MCDPLLTGGLGAVTGAVLSISDSAGEK